MLKGGRAALVSPWATRGFVTNDSDPFRVFQEASLTAIEVPVLKVFDGDGFLTKFAFSDLLGDPTDEVKATIRFAFIGAPELEQRGGREARDFLTSFDRWANRLD